ncbi:hypothetical protein K466DRAFT_26548 [Polyporus arcularius HHB13444]|uniref:Uncharacterized protein n=1 Tax=Polyporus arcularius HHB13444 TaxID=1314778 RepID=A0A5C3NP47_9APHY|nr:hypothetical protein K466DRAFT_26548 [Polyporus arcularius HHB13444]
MSVYTMHVNEACNHCSSPQPRKPPSTSLSSALAFVKLAFCESSLSGARVRLYKRRSRRQPRWFRRSTDCVTVAITPEQTLQWGVLGMLGNTLPMEYLLHLELRVALVIVEHLFLTCRRALNTTRRSFHSGTSVTTPSSLLGSHWMFAAHKYRAPSASWVGTPALRRLLKVGHRQPAKVRDGGKSQEQPAPNDSAKDKPHSCIPVPYRVGSPNYPSRT